MAETDTIFAHVSGVFEQLIAGEVAFRTRAEQGLRAGLSQWYAIGALNVRLHLRAGVEGRVDEEEGLADLRLRARLVPARTPVAKDIAQEHIRVRAMPFLAREDGRLVIRTGREKLRVRFKKNGAIKIAEDRQGAVFTKLWPARWIAEIFQCLARWSSEDNAPPKPGDHASPGAIDRQIVELVANFVNVESPSSKLSAMLGAYHQLDEFDAQLGWRLRYDQGDAQDDDDGPDASDVPSMFELRATLDHASERPCLRIEHGIAGIVNGPRKRSIWTALLEAKNLAEKFRKEIHGKHPSNDSFQHFLEGVGEAGAFIARLDVGESRYVAFIGGDEDHYLMFEFSLSDPPADGDPDVVRLGDGLKVIVGSWGKAKTPIRLIGPGQHGQQKDKALHAYVSVLLHNLDHMSRTSA